MVYFLFGFCFCLSLDRIIEWFQLRSYDRRNHRSYLNYSGYSDQDRLSWWRIRSMQRRLDYLVQLADQWHAFKAKYPDMSEDDEESEEEDI